MKTVKYCISSAILLSFLVVSACSSTTDPAEAYKGETADQIYQGGESALRDKNYTEAIKRFEALDVQYPFGRDTETAELHIIYAYYMNSDYVSAEAAADRYIHSHPTSPNADYAYYMKGLSDFYQNLGVFERIFSVDYSTRDLTQVKKSYNDFAQLINQYPRSYYAPAAHQYMIYLRNVLANHQFEVAHFYYDREAYVASANRAGTVVQNYQGSPRVPDALVMMAKSYHQLQMRAQEEEVIRVLQYNYPNSKYVEEVSGNQINSKKFSVVARPEQAIPPPAGEQVAPPQLPPPAPVKVRVKRVRHAQPEAIVAPVQPEQTQVAPKTEKPAPAQQNKPAPQESIRQNGDRGSSGFDVMETLDKLTASEFFKVSPKKPANQAQPQQQTKPQQQPTQQPQSTNTLPQTQPVVDDSQAKNNYPVISQNGSR